MNLRLICFLFHIIYVACIPSVHPGSADVISGVETCGHGAGYCLRGDDCTVDGRLVSDEEGHCDGLRDALPPSAHYSCCRQVAKNSTLELEGVVTAVLNSTEISDSVDVLNRANDVAADTNDVNSDHPENEVSDTTNANEQDGELMNDINYLCCSPPTANVDDDNGDAQTPVEAINSRSMSGDNEAELIAESSSTDDEAVQEFLKIHRALFGDHVENERNCTGHEHYASLLPLSLSNGASKGFRGASIKEKFDKNKCVNLTNQFEEAEEGCINVWKFLFNDELLCVGTLINSVWLLTSAACVTKIFNEGERIDTIVVTDIEEKSGYYGISNMIVHENYMIEGLSDMHDVGLISLNQIVNTSCFACLPVEERKYVDKSCTTYMMSGNRKSREYLGKCQDRLKILNMNSKMYLSLPCSTDTEHPFATDGHSANALWCENKLVGIETSYDQGYFVFTPINDYVEWITNNVQLYL